MNLQESPRTFVWLPCTARAPTVRSKKRMEKGKGWEGMRVSCSKARLCGGSSAQILRLLVLQKRTKTAVSDQFDWVSMGCGVEQFDSGIHNDSRPMTTVH